MSSCLYPTLMSNDLQRMIYNSVCRSLKRGSFTQVHLGFKVVHFLEVENRKTLIKHINNWFIICSIYLNYVYQ